jgi:hypothetical protein
MSTGTDDQLKFTVCLDRSSFQIIEREASKEGVTIGQLARDLLAKEYGIQPEVQCKRKSVPFSPQCDAFLRRHGNVMRLSRLVEELEKRSGVRRNPGSVINRMVTLGIVQRESRSRQSKQLQS